MTQKTIRKHLKALRAECIDGTDDPVLRRMAYAMETAVRRVTEPVVGWPSLVEEAQSLSKLLVEELARRQALEKAR